jgi:hypothetical protein
LNARKTHCSKCGGEFSRDKDGKRFCRVCRKAHAAAYYLNHIKPRL